MTLRKRGRAMHEDHRELMRRLFATATEIAEAAHVAASKGQSARLKQHECLACAGRLGKAARDLAAIAEAVAIVSCGDHADGRTRSPKRMRRKTSTSP